MKGRKHKDLSSREKKVICNLFDHFKTEWEQQAGNSMVVLFHVA